MGHFSKSSRWDSGHIIQTLHGARPYRNFYPSLSFHFQRDFQNIGLSQIRNFCTDTFFAVHSREKPFSKIKRKLVFDNRRCESHCVRSVFADIKKGDGKKEGRKEGKEEGRKEGKEEGSQTYDTSHVGRIKN
jgi:hypothetical protein